MKTKEDILNQPYMCAEDLKILMPQIGIKKCREYIQEVRDIMVDKKLTLPMGRTQLALTKLVKKKFGL